MHIRTYETEDLHETVTLWWETRRSVFPYIQEKYTFEEYTSHFRDVAVKNQVWIAQLDNKIIGFMAMRDNCIQHLYVSCNCQRQGVGKALLEIAKQHSPTQLSLYTFQKNIPARTFYEKHGFKAVKFGLSPDEGEPDIYYEWHKT
jgi:ribosomal protein S18 acetylase RimI-like enzyme